MVCIELQKSSLGSFGENIIYIYLILKRIFELYINKI